MPDVTRRVVEDSSTRGPREIGDSSSRASVTPCGHAEGSWSPAAGRCRSRWPERRRARSTRRTTGRPARRGPRPRYEPAVPPRLVLTMICSNWLTSASRPSVVRVYSKLRSAELGSSPILPAATWTFCSRRASSNFAGGQVAGLEQLRIEPDPHAVVLGAEHHDFADAFDPGQHVLDLGGRVVAQMYSSSRVPSGEYSADHHDHGSATASWWSHPAA